MNPHLMHISLLICAAICASLFFNNLFEAISSYGKSVKLDPKYKQAHRKDAVSNLLWSLLHFGLMAACIYRSALLVPTL